MDSLLTLGKLSLGIFNLSHKDTLGPVIEASRGESLQEEQSVDLLWDTSDPWH